MNFKSSIVKFIFRFYVYVRPPIYIVLGVFDWILGLKPRSMVNIYCYHSIGDDKHRFSVTENDFKKQIDFLLAKYRPISLTEAVDFARGNLALKKPSFVITFDDGYKNIALVKDFLKSRGVKPTVFVLSEPAEVDRNALAYGGELLDAEGIVKLASDGFEIGSHSATHPDFGNLEFEKIEPEVGGSKRTIETKTNLPVSYFAYPKGKYDERVLSAVEKAGYAAAVSMNDGLIKPGSDLLSLPRIGVDGSHSFWEFKHLASPSVVFIRSLIKGWAH
jgi:peptidoglycan/xylan/chitin deacetylase (PgdA/CDA1 family)